MGPLKYHIGIVKYQNVIILAYWSDLIKICIQLQNDKIYFIVGLSYKYNQQNFPKQLW